MILPSIKQRWLEGIAMIVLSVIFYIEMSRNQINWQNWDEKL
jgi:hypothetical protein